jgi:Trk K+ transport system NAD-binding subunit
MIVDWIVDFRQKERTGMGKQTVRDHLLLVNFPSEARVRQIINEFRSDTRYRATEIVLLTDQIEALPFQMDKVSFTRGWPLESGTYERANISHASQAIVLSTGYDDPRSDSMVASITFILNNVNPDLHIVAECLDPKHDVLFSHSNQLSLVYPLEMANNLLVQESQDPGVTKLTQVITSNAIDGTLASTKVRSDVPTNLGYVEIAKKFLDHGVNLIGIIRNEQIIIELRDVAIKNDDSVVYISKSRHSWEDLGEFLA